MKRLLLLLVWLAGVGIATVSMSRWWYRHPDHFPRLPDGLWQTFDHLLGVATVDGARDVELAVVVLLSFVLVVLAGSVVLLIFRLVRRRPGP